MLLSFVLYDGTCDAASPSTLRPEPTTVPTSAPPHACSIGRLPGEPPTRRLSIARRASVLGYRVAASAFGRVIRRSPRARRRYQWRLTSPPPRGRGGPARSSRGRTPQSSTPRSAPPANASGALNRIASGCEAILTIARAKAERGQERAGNPITSGPFDRNGHVAELLDLRAPSRPGGLARTARATSQGLAAEPATPPTAPRTSSPISSRRSTRLRTENHGARGQFGSPTLRCRDASITER